MKSGKCRCGNRIFFSNVACLACSASLGRCALCNALTSFQAGDGRYQCDSCGELVQPCKNHDHATCNSYTPDRSSLCRWCEFTKVIPDLTDAKGQQRWQVLENAKRRLLLELLNLGLPPFAGKVSKTHPLRFQFLQDSQLNSNQGILTGHQDGLITIDLVEADDAEREKRRVELGEPQRTLIGHMRHEYGHYLDWSLASRFAMREYVRLFGDPNAIDYQQSLDRHYRQGVRSHWATNYVSAYATVHPWEDFAESVNAYLDIVAIAVTANDHQLAQVELSADSDPGKIIADVLKIVVVVSEFNFDLGLPALLPERLPKPVIEKIAFVHSLRSIAVANGS